MPEAVIERRFGAEIEREVLGELLRESLAEALRAHALEPVRPPRVERADREGDGAFTYVVSFDEYPEVEVPDLGALEIERPVAEVAESDVEAMIETLRKQRARWQAVTRSARAGDLVVFEFSATGEGWSHPEQGRERAGTVLGSAALGTDLEERLTGLAAGASAEWELDFPADFRIAALAGRRARIALEVLRVQERVLPEVDAEFVRGFGIADGDLARFRAEVRANLERELEDALAALLRREVLDRLLAAAPEFELPASMVEDLAAELARGEDGKVSAERLREVEATARRRARGAVLLRRIARAAGIVAPDPERLRRALARIASTYEDPKGAAELLLAHPRAACRARGARG
ncbi:MAG: trigger factor [Xanthomonadales bacterium]|nr:trigger factor [Xanthomonadales bacterium]